MLGFLKKIFGDKHAKDIKYLYPIVDEINIEFAKLSALTDEELKSKTAEFKKKIADDISELQLEITEAKNTLQKDISNEERDQLHEKAVIREL